MKFTLSEPYQTSYKIPTPTHGRQLVIADIHGCLDTLNALLKKVDFCKSDQLFLLGDYINRGKHSAGVLNLILQLIEDDFQIFPLRGNHEQMSLDSHIRRIEEQDFRRAYALHRRKDLVNDKGLLFPKYFTLFQALPFYYELEKFYLAHAGFNFESEKPFEDWIQMIWLREAQFDAEKTQGKRIIYGHVSHNLEQISEAISTKKNLIPLDNSVYKKNEDGKGNLCCYDITSQQLFVQANIES